ncbi:TIGR02680 family protein [Embleya sp. NPDC059237]|uniref:TIGR02680 family protein n=1 Tax=Embleya sp. NPDC059237 TaxID=3346784 RepID=UPI00367A96D4
MSPILPHPTRERWQPLRTGLVDLFHYDVEEFHFRDGRLLLRGNNGTGKSKVLALTLPFLVDGDLSAHRVEPDGDPRKRMEWNLLLGGEHPHSERLGYTWIEFGRRADDGTVEFRTLGCGLKAVAGRGVVRHWYFVTTQRVGEDLSLIDGTRTALTRDRLTEALAGHGLVHDQAAGYRRAVDDALFGLGEQRYAALVDLLIQLRQPQLSKRPSEKALSKALTEALAPMDQAVVADVAEAFRSLDEDQARLAAMAETEQAATTFLTHYQRYAKVASRRRARAPRSEHARHDALRAEFTRAGDEEAAAELRVAAAEELISECTAEAARLQAKDEALRAGPEMRSARELDRAAEAARAARADATQAEEDARRASEDERRASERADGAGARLTVAVREVAAVRREAADAAAQAILTAAHAEHVAAAPADEPRVRRAADDLVDRRRRTVELLAGLHRDAERLAGVRTVARQRLADIEAELAAQAEEHERCADVTRAAKRSFVAAVQAYLAECAELRPADPLGLLDELTVWADTLAGPDPVRVATDAAARERHAVLAAQAAAVAGELRDVDGQAGRLRAELADLRAGGTRPPRPPYTRDDTTRTARPGAPLWRLVDFTDAVPDGADRAGLEAALEASGLLDAWVDPDGTATSVGTGELLVRPGPPVAGPTLGDVLSPAVDRADERAAAVPDAMVGRLLAAIGWGPDSAAATRVAADGTFTLGVLTGRWTKPNAEYLGAGARERARRARIEAVAAELAELDVRRADIVDRTAAVTTRQRRLDDELAGRPGDEALRRAHAQVAAAGTRLAALDTRRAEQERHVVAAATRADEAADEARRAAVDTGLPTAPEELASVSAGLARYREVLAALWPALREHTAASAAAASERVEAERVAVHAGDLRERAAVAERRALAAESGHETLAATVGAAVAELQRELTATRLALRGCEDATRRAHREHTDAVKAGGVAQGRREQLERDVAESARTRDEAVAALRRFASTGLLTVALPELEVPAPDSAWAADPSVRFARRIERELEQIEDSDQAWERVQRRVAEELKNLQDALGRHGHTASGHMLEDGVVVDVLFQGRTSTVAGLATSLAAEVEARRRLLSAREREILENHLISEVAGTLQELIGAAERRVAVMNGELAARPTSTGMKLRLVWRPAKEAPTGLAAARARLLRQTADAWTAEDRAAVGEFLQAEIARVRSRDAGGTWVEQLTTALDYRSWHEFGIERHQHGQWSTATGPASGGERVLAASVPLFAAASSHYASAANPYAPRLVTLDEAFAGVDDDSRAKCLGLLAAFDLDVVMTSEREWGCYPEVPGLAIAQLSRVDDIAAVLVTRWEWNGEHRFRAVDPEPMGLSATVPAPRPGGSDGATQDELWT